MTVSRVRHDPSPATPAPTGTAPRVLDNFVETNRAMAKQIYQDVCSFSRHPLASLTAMAEGAAWPLVHPVAAAKRAWRDIKADPLGGGVDAAALATGEAYIGLVIVAGAATLAAPLTGGASLAVAAGALGIADGVGLACLGIDAAGIALHETRGAMAKSPEQLKDEAGQLASYVEDEAIQGATWKLGNALEAHAPGKSATLKWLLNDTVGTPGVYEQAPGN